MSTLTIAIIIIVTVIIIMIETYMLYELICMAIKLKNITNSTLATLEASIKLIEETAKALDRKN